MNVTDMHISVNHGVQKIASHQVDVLLPAEIDHELNKAQMNFIKQRYGTYSNRYMRGFEQSQKRIDDLRTLLKEQSLPTTFKGQISSKHYIDTCVLPDDYMFLINQRSLTAHNNCHPIEFGEVNVDRVWIEIPTNELPSDSLQQSLNTPIIPIGTGCTAPYFWAISGITIDCLDENFNPTSLTLGSPTGNPTTWGIQNYNSAPTSTTGFEFSATDVNGDAPTTVPTTGGVICVLLPIGYTLPDLTYNYINTMNPNGFGQIQLSMIDYTCNTYPTLTHTDLTISLGQVNIFTASNQGIAQTSRDLASSYDISQLQELELVTATSKNRWSQHDDIYTLLDDPFNTTKHTSPLTTIVGGNIDVYTNNTFFVPNVKVTYIKLPRTISITPAQNCLLPMHTHQEIVDIAIASILEGIQDVRYQSFQNELTRTE